MRTNYFPPNANYCEIEICERAKNIVAAHASELALRRRALSRPLSYGLVDDIPWHNEVNYFIDECIEVTNAKVSHSLALRRAVETMIDVVTLGLDFPQPNYSDTMHPADYERMVATSLTELGWQTETVGGSGDQGIDVIASMRDRRVVVQCKRYASAAGNDAVQQAHAGRSFAGADFAAVVSSAGFTRAAVELAQRTGVNLLHHNDLLLLESQIFGTSATVMEGLGRARSASCANMRAAEILRVTPSNYELFVTHGLARIGWRILSTASRMDEEIVAEWNQFRIVVDCAGFFSIDESDVQRIFDVRERVEADVAVIVSDQRISEGAQRRAATIGVLMLSHYDLESVTSRIGRHFQKSRYAATESAPQVVKPSEFAGTVAVIAGLDA